MDSDQLDDLKDCIEGIYHIYKTRAIVHAHKEAMDNKDMMKMTTFA